MSFNSIFAHELILSKIIARDSAGAEQAMAEHLSDV
jgi:DNA-binding GntR family transcriptional regulator